MAFEMGGDGNEIMNCPSNLFSVELNENVNQQV